MNGLDKCSACMKIMKSEIMLIAGKIEKPENENYQWSFRKWEKDKKVVMW